MATITNAGVGSNLDLESIINATLQAEYTPKAQRIQKQESKLNVQLTGLGAIKSVLAKLQDTMKTLADPEVFNKRTATVKQPDNATSLGDLLTVSASSTATPGSFNLAVTQLAKGSRAVSAAGSTFTSANEVVSASGGQLTIAAGTKTFNVTVAAGSTLEQVRQAINNSNTNFGVSVNIVNTGTESKLVVNSNVTGDGNDLVITGNNAEFDRITTQAFGGGAGGLAIAVADKAQNGKITVDGQEIVSTSNTFKDAVQGLTITAKRQSNAAETAKATVDVDRAGVTKKIDEFVTAFNNTIDMINEQSLLVSSPLYGDATVRSLKAQLVTTLSAKVTDAGIFNNVFDIGISLNKSYKLEKTSKTTSLNEAMDTNFNDVTKLFTNTDGVAKNLEKMLTSYLDSKGVIKLRQNAIDDGLKTVKEDKANLDYRLEVMEKNLRKRYASLDVLIAKMRGTGSSLNNSLASLPGFTKS